MQVETNDLVAAASIKWGKYQNLQAAFYFYNTNKNPKIGLKQHFRRMYDPLKIHPRPRHYSLIEASGVFAVRWLMGLPTRPINLLIETSLRTCGFDVSKKVIPTIPLTCLFLAATW